MHTDDHPFASLLAISYYHKIADLNQEHGIYLVQHIETGEICVRKDMTVYNRCVYEQLQTAPIPGIPCIYHLHEDKEKGILTVIEEYVPGMTLEQYLQERGPMTEQKAADCGLQLCAVLARLHESMPPVIHRDIKPSNIIRREDGSYVLIDLNAARQYADGSGTTGKELFGNSALQGSDSGKERDTRLLGTVGFAAPEQYGFGQSSPRSDIYAMGKLLERLLRGSGEATKNERTSPSRKMSQIIERCTQIDPQDRYASVRELQKDLRRIKRAPRDKAAYPGQKCIFEAVASRTEKARRIRLTPALAGAGILLLIMAALVTGTVVFIKKNTTIAKTVDNGIETESAATDGRTMGAQGDGAESLAKMESGKASAISESEDVESRNAESGDAENNDIEGEDTENKDTENKDAESKGIESKDNQNEDTGSYGWIGTYEGEVGDHLVLREDGTADYYLQEYTELSIPWEEKEGTISLYLPKLHCTIQAKVTEGKTAKQLYFTSAHAGWDNETFKRCDKLSPLIVRSAKKTYDENATLQEDGTLLYEQEGYCFVLPREYIDNADEGDSNDDFSEFFSADVDTGAYSMLLFYQMENTVLSETVATAESTAALEKTVSSEKNASSENNSLSESKEGFLKLSKEMAGRFFEELTVSEKESDEISTVAESPAYQYSFSGRLKNSFGHLGSDPAKGEITLIYDKEHGQILAVMISAYAGDTEGGEDTEETAASEDVENALSAYHAMLQNAVKKQ